MTAMASPTPSAQPSRRRGEPQSWPLANSLQDPALGLTYEQLTDLWQPYELLPVGWSEEMAARVADATHRILSLAIGEMQGRRQRWGQLGSSLALTMLTDVEVDDLDEKARAKCGPLGGASTTHDHDDDDGAQWDG